MILDKRKMVITAISAVILLLISVILTSCMGMGPFSSSSQNAGTQQIETFKVQRGNIYQTVSTTGSVDSNSLNTYNMQVSGEVLSALEKGDYFKKDDILVEVDNSEGQLQLEQAEKNLKLSEISLTAAKLNYQAALDSNHIAIQTTELNTKKAEESTESALNSLENANEMGDSYSISQAKSSYKQAQLNQSTTYWNNLSSLQSAERQIDSTRDNIEQAEIQLEQANMDYESAKKGLIDYILYAPYDGVVISSDFITGNQNSAGNTISIISSNFLIKSTIGESDISKVSVGNDAYITLDAYPDYQIPGKVKEIIPVAKEENNIVSFEISVDFNDTGDVEVFYGLSADIEKG
jgi:multidrug resistance efflux pump